MSHKSKLRLAGIIFIFAFILIWWVPTNGVLNDYHDLINKTDEVRLSLITLIVPIGGLGALAVILFQVPWVIFYGKGMSDIFSAKVMNISNKIAMYSFILGVVSAIGFSIYSINLLDEYGYKYSSELTKITPTGIHLMYVKKMDEDNLTL